MTAQVAVVAAVLLAAAVLTWPTRGTPRWTDVSRGLHPGPEHRSSAEGRAATEGLAGSPEVLSVHGGAGGQWPPSAAVGRLMARRRERDARGAAVLELLDALGPALAAGLTPALALDCLRPSSNFARGLVAELAAAAGRGEPLAPIWHEEARRMDSVDVALVGSAWALCEQLGSPLAHTTRTVAGTLRQRQAVRRRVDAALAGPRATALVLTCLPATGPVVAMLLGVPLSHLYANAGSLAAVLLGLGLVAAGWVWCRRLTRSVAYP
ncbi:MAG: type II secretion system F family protein [Actinomycetota bacterium]|nr:type II secretion system F family protein [Actinomycetota bacterium]